MPHANETVGEKTQPQTFFIVYKLLWSSSRYKSEAIERTQLESVRKVPIYIILINNVLK